MSSIDWISHPVHAPLKGELAIPGDKSVSHRAMMFAALAGYDPREAVPFWQRMAAKSAGAAKQPEFLSTHPADATRIAELQKIMDETVRLYYKPR